MRNPDSKFHKWIFFLLLIAGMTLLFILQNILSVYPFFPHQLVCGLLFGILIVVLMYWNHSGKIRSAIPVKAKRQFRLRNSWLSGAWILICCLNLSFLKSSNGFIYSSLLVVWLYQLVWSFYARGIYFGKNRIYSFSLVFYTLNASAVSAAEINPEGLVFFYKSVRGSTQVRKDDYADAEWEKVVFLMNEWCVRNEVVMR